MANVPEAALELRSTITKGGRLEIALESVPIRAPGADDVVVRVEASPVNPSDLGLLFGAADISTAKSSGAGAEARVTAEVPSAAMGMMSGRFDQPMAVGNEGAGIVVAAGADQQDLIGRTVAMIGGSMYSEYRVVPAAMCLVLEPGTAPRAAASCFVNPLTALGMVETMRLEGHSALVHTAAASNLGQMLNKICLADGVGLVNVVRKPEQEKILQDIGAPHIVNSSSPSFRQDLTDAIAETGATLAFDATGGGTLGGQVLAAMEAAQLRKAEAYSGYGSTTHKQLYIYGGLDRSPTTFDRSFGMAWGMGGWLLPHFLAKVGAETGGRLRARVVAELETTFASHYTQDVPLTGLLDVATLQACGRQATGEKFLVTPHAA